MIKKPVNIKVFKEVVEMPPLLFLSLVLLIYKFDP